MNVIDTYSDQHIFVLRQQRHLIPVWQQKHKV